MIIYYVRHGEPHYDQYDTLTDRGVYQVNEIAKYLTNIPFTKCFISPVHRARLSGEPTFTKLNLEPIVVDWASEDFAWVRFHSDFGSGNTWTFNGLKYKEIFRKYFDKPINEFYSNEEIKKTNLELIQEYVNNGIDKWFETLGFTVDRKNKKYIANNVHDKNIILFAHQGISTFIFPSLLFDTYPHFFVSHKLIDCASISVFDVDEKTGKITLEVYNDIKY